MCQFLLLGNLLVWDKREGFVTPLVIGLVGSGQGKILEAEIWGLFFGFKLAKDKVFLIS